MKYGRIKVLCFLLPVLFSVACRQKPSAGVTANEVFSRTEELKAISGKIAGDPENARFYFERGNLLHQINEDTLALSDYKRAAALDTTKAEYLSAVGDLMFEHKDIAGSVSWIARAVRLNPEDPRAHLKIAKLFIYTKDYTKAFAEINTVLRQNTLTPEGYFLKGLIYKDLKDTAKAISSFQTCVQVDPEYRDAIVQLGLLHSALKQPVALRYLDNAFRLDSSDVFPLYARGMYYQEQGKYEEAKREYRDCRIHNPDYANAYFSTGWILLQQDSLSPAWQEFDLVTKLEPARAAAWYNRGLCSELMNKNGEALQDYKKALTLDEQYKEAKDGIERLREK